MISLNFSYNWNNKLNSNYFTTIRRSCKIDVGEDCAIFLRDKFQFHATCVQKRVLRLIEIPDYILMLDTGYSIKESLQIFDKLNIGETTIVELITFEKKQEKKPSQQLILFYE